jgi:biotin transporter BioY
MLCAHVLILALGWARLSWAIGPSQAWWQGVGPFVGGGVVKSLVAALVVVAVGGLKASIPPRSSQ